MPEGGESWFILPSRAGQSPSFNLVPHGKCLTPFCRMHRALFSPGWQARSILSPVRIRSVPMVPHLFDPLARSILSCPGEGTSLTTHEKWMDDFSPLKNIHSGFGIFILRFIMTYNIKIRQCFDKKKREQDRKARFADMTEGFAAFSSLSIPVSPRFSPH